MNSKAVGEGISSSRADLALLSEEAGSCSPGPLPPARTAWPRCSGGGLPGLAPRGSSLPAQFTGSRPELGLSSIAPILITVCLSSPKV